MKFYLFAFALLFVGVVYTNYYISSSEAEKSTQFIVSQKDASAMTANLLEAKENLKTQIKTSQKKSEVKKPVEITKTEVITQSSIFSLIKAIPGTSIQTWDAGKNLTLTFNKEFDISNFYQNFRFPTAVDGNFSGNVMISEDLKTITLEPVPVLKPGDYKLTILKSFSDLQGNALGNDVEFTIHIQ